jgi:hypothetical protein
MRDARHRRGRACRQGRGRSRSSDHGRLPLRKGVELPRPRVLRGSAAAPVGPRRRRPAAGVVGRGARSRCERPDRGARRVWRRVDPALLVHGHAGPDPGRRDERACDERTGRKRLGAHDLRDRGIHRHADDARPLARGRSGGVAQRALRDRVGVEPDVHGAAPVAQAARRARGRRAAARGGPVPQPHGACCRRAHQAPARHRRGSGNRDDAGGRRCGTARRRVVPGACGWL